MSEGYLWIFDEWEGYPCFNPLVITIEMKGFQEIVRILGGWPVVCLINSISALGSYAYYKNSWTAGLLFVILLLCLTIPLKLTKIRCDPWLQRVRVIVMPFNNEHHVDIYAIIAHIDQAIRQVILKNPSVKFIIMPESTLPFPLNDYKPLVSALMEALQGRELIIGGHYKEKGKIYNCCYHLCSKKDTYYFYLKQHRMFFLERMPVWWGYICCKEWFLKESFCFEPGNQVTYFTLDDQILLFPLVCSDIFFKPLITAKMPLVGLINDAWFKGTSLPHLLLNLALIKALVSSNDILYVSHTRACFIKKDGTVCTLARVCA
jgi:apolipoprotein N-acyltransferase